MCFWCKTKVLWKFQNWDDYAWVNAVGWGSCLVKCLGFNRLIGKEVFGHCYKVIPKSLCILIRCGPYVPHHFCVHFIFSPSFSQWLLAFCLGFFICFILLDLRLLLGGILLSNNQQMTHSYVEPLCGRGNIPNMAIGPNEKLRASDVETVSSKANFISFCDSPVRILKSPRLSHQRS